MADLEYMDNRKKYQRPQGLLFADNPGKIENGRYIPNGNEFEDFIILSDDNRGSIDVKFDRIEKRERMINGRMRSYHIADKIKIGTSWSNLPSRAFFDGQSSIEEDGKTSLQTRINKKDYTSDGGAGGVDILDWYESHEGSFWVYLAYDKYSNFETQTFNRLGQYNQIVEVFFSGFDYTIQKRGGSNFDFWDISLDLEEV